MAPAPKSRVPKGEVVASPDSPTAVGDDDLIDLEDDSKPQHQTLRRVGGSDSQALKANGSYPERGASPKPLAQLRRASSATANSDRESGPKRSNPAEWRDHLKHLGPSNLASRPRQTRYNTVKIKPGGGGSLPDNVPRSREPSETPRNLSTSTAPHGGVGTGLLHSAGKDAKDGVLAVQEGHGNLATSPRISSKSRQTLQDGQNDTGAQEQHQRSNSITRSPPRESRSASSQSTVGSLPNRSSPLSKVRKTHSVARSGSITENIIDAGGVKKTVLETTSSSSDDVEDGAAGAATGSPNGQGSQSSEDADKVDAKAKEIEGGGKKKRRRRKRKGGKAEAEAEGDEETPLLGERS